MSDKRLDVLVIEDSEDDALLMVRELRRGSYDITFERVETPSALRSALKSHQWDVILSDFSLPSFNALDALRLVRDLDNDTPFILLSGVANEDVAVLAMKAGAQDFFAKENLTRLLPAVEREICDAEHRRKRNWAESELRRSEERFVKAFHSSPLAISISTVAEGIFLDINPQYLNLFGYRREELIGHSILDLQIWVNPEERAELVQRLPEQKSVHSLEVSLRAKAGTKRDCLVSFEEIELNNEPCILEMIVDITERKQAEKATKEAEQFAQNTVNSLSAHIAIVDANATIVAVNDAWKSFAIENNGESGSVGVGANYLNVSDVTGMTEDAQTARAFADGLRQILNGERDIFSLEYPCHSLDEERWFEGRITKFKGNKRANAVVAHENITARVKADQEVARREKRFSALIANSTDIISIFDKVGVGQYHSPAIKRVMGYPPELLVGLNVKQVIHPDDMSLVEDSFSRLPTEPGSSLTVEVRVRHADGNWRWLQAVISNLFDEPMIDGFIVNSRDITDQKRAEIETIRLNGELAERNTELSTMYEIGRVLANTVDEREIYQIMYQAITQNLSQSADLVISSFDNETLESRCEFAVINGKEQQSIDPQQVKWDKGATLDAIRTGKPHIELDVAHIDRTLRTDNDQITRSTLIIPLIVAGEVHSVMQLMSVSAHAFDNINLDLISTIASQAAMTLRNVQTLKNTQSYAGKLEEHVVERTQQLERLNHRMAVVVNTASDAIILLDAAGTVEITNPAFDSLFDYKPDELLGQPLTLVVATEHKDTLSQAIYTLLTDEGQRLTFTGIRSDGSSIDIEASLARVPNNEQHIVCTMHNISHLKVVERMKDQFISTVNHELRNPIAGILLSSDSLFKYYDRMSDTQRLKKVSRIRQQTNVMMELVNAILDLSRMEAQHTGIRRLPVDLCQVARNVVSELAPSAEEKNQHIEFSLDMHSVLIIGDDTDFASMWRNLIGNAIKYTPEGGKIEVRLASYTKTSEGITSSLASIDGLPEHLPLGDYAIGQVKDTGHGISSADINLLFTRFYRGWAKTSQIPGTGLGLALVRELLEIHDGDIRVESELGKGSTFTFWIPINNTNGGIA